MTRMMNQAVRNTVLIAAATALAASSCCTNALEETPSMQVLPMEDINPGTFEGKAESPPMVVPPSMANTECGIAMDDIHSEESDLTMATEDLFDAFDQKCGEPTPEGEMFIQDFVGGAAGAQEGVVGLGELGGGSGTEQEEEGAEIVLQQAPAPPLVVGDPTKAVCIVPSDEEEIEPEIRTVVTYDPMSDEFAKVKSACNALSGGYAFCTADATFAKVGEDPLDPMKTSGMIHDIVGLPFCIPPSCELDNDEDDVSMLLQAVYNPCEEDEGCVVLDVTNLDCGEDEGRIIDATTTKTCSMGVDETYVTSEDSNSTYLDLNVAKETLQGSAELACLPVFLEMLGSMGEAILGGMQGEGDAGAAMMGMMDFSTTPPPMEENSEALEAFVAMAEAVAGGTEQEGEGAVTNAENSMINVDGLTNPADIFSLLLGASAPKTEAVTCELESEPVFVEFKGNFDNLMDDPRYATHEEECATAKGRTCKISIKVDYRYSLGPATGGVLLDMKNIPTCFANQCGDDEAMEFAKDIALQEFKHLADEAGPVGGLRRTLMEVHRDSRRRLSLSSRRTQEGTPGGPGIEPQLLEEEGLVLGAQIVPPEDVPTGVLEEGGPFGGEGSPSGIEGGGAAIIAVPPGPDDVDILAACTDPASLPPHLKDIFNCTLVFEDFQCNEMPEMEEPVMADTNGMGEADPTPATTMEPMMDATESAIVEIAEEEPMKSADSTSSMDEQEEGDSVDEGEEASEAGVLSGLASSAPTHATSFATTLLVAVVCVIFAS